MKPTNPISRRSFVSTAAAGMAALGAFSSVGPLTPSANAQELETTSQWDLAAFNKLAHTSAPVKQLFDVTVAGGGAFDHIQNYLNSVHFGFGIPGNQIQPVAVMRGPASALIFDDSMWKKYQFGAFANVTDPKTKKPAERNIFYPSKTNLKYPTDNFEDPRSIYHDSSIQALQHRGLRLIGCHIATWFIARMVAEKLHLKQPHKEIYDDLVAHTLPGVMIAAAAVGAIGMLQTQGHYSYLYVG